MKKAPQVVSDRHIAPIRYSLKYLLAVVGAVAASLGIVRLTGSIGLGVHLSVCLAGWLLWRTANVHFGGVIPTLLGVDILLNCSIDWVHDGAEDFMGFRSSAIIFAEFLVVLGIGLTVWFAVRRRRFWRRQMGIALVFLSLLVAWSVTIPGIGNAAITRRRRTDNAANNRATAQAISTVEEFRRQTGRCPLENELPEMPSVRWDGFSTQIRYERMTVNSYQLHYVDPTIFMGDRVIYESDKPKKGWYRVPF